MIGTISQPLQQFVEHREEVIKYIRAELIAQGSDKLDIAMCSAGIKLWASRDVENIYRCIHSDLEDEDIRAIVAHDFTGLIRRDPFFSPKSRQFEEEL